MTELFRVEKPAGINRLQEETQEDPRMWQDAYNVRFQHGITKKVDGYEEGLGVSLVDPEIIVPLRDDSGEYYWWSYVGLNQNYIGEDPNLPSSEKLFNFYRITSTIAHTESTPDVFYEPTTGRDYKWTGDSINGVPFLTYGVPYYYDSSTGKYTMFENIPRVDPLDSSSAPRVRFNVIRSYKNFMIGMNFDTDDYAGYFNEGDHNPPIYWGPWEEGVHQNAVWWSHTVIGKDVDVQWQDANSILSSGWNFLGGSGGNIVDGKTLRDSFLLYRERSVWQMTYIGGVQIFAFKEIFNDVGCLGLDCIVEIDGEHIVVGQSDVYRHNGVRKQTICDGIIRREIFETIHPEHTENVFLATDYKNKEVWLCIPSADQETVMQERGIDVDSYRGSCDIAYVYNWVENTWSKKDIPYLTGSIYTILSITSEDISWLAPGEVSGPGSTWEEATDTWSSSFFRYNPAEWGIAMTSKSQKIYTSIKEPLITDQSDNVTNFEASVEKTYMDMGERLITKHISRIYPLVRGSGGSGTGSQIKVYMGESMTLSEGIVWEEVGIFDSSKDEHLACRVTGRYIHVKFVIPEESRAEIRGYWLEYDMIGRR